MKSHLILLSGLPNSNRLDSIVAHLNRGRSKRQDIFSLLSLCIIAVQKFSNLAHNTKILTAQNRLVTPGYQQREPNTEHIVRDEILVGDVHAGRPGSSEVPRNPLTRWDVSSIPANGTFLTKKLKNKNKNAQRVEND